MVSRVLREEGRIGDGEGGRERRRGGERGSKGATICQSFRFPLSGASLRQAVRPVGLLQRQGTSTKITKEVKQKK